LSEATDIDIPVDHGGHLAENIAYFARALRVAGIPVGPRSVLDAVEAVSVATIGGRDDLYWTLHAVFVTRREQTFLFDQAFRLFFRRKALLERMMSELMHQAPGDPNKNKDVAKRIQEALAERVRAEENSKAVGVEERRQTQASVSDRDVSRAKDFEQMSSAEIAAAKRAIRNLVLPDDTVVTRRMVAMPRGERIDPRRTMRASMRHGGGLIDLKRRTADERRPPIVALLDISDSVSAYGRIFMHFLHALGQSGRKVQAFTFATRLTNVSRSLRSHRDPDEALAACGKLATDWDGGTRIAASLHRFNRDWGRRVLAGGAVVLLVTDGLDRVMENDDQSHDLAREIDRLHRSCRRLIWLNPLLRYAGFEALASGIRTMLPHVDEFRTVHSLDSLGDLAAALDRRRTLDADPARWLARVA
jgi:uncharacterized protein